MDEIFRFLFLRPPAPGKAVTVTPSAAFATELAQAHNSPNRKAALKAAAGKLVSSGRGVGKLADLALGNALVAAQEALAPLDDVKPEQLAEIVKTAFGKPPGQIVGTAEFTKDRERLADNLLAAKLLSRDGAVEARQMEALLRLMVVIDRLAANDAGLKTPGAVRAALDRPTQIGQPIAAPSRDVPKEEPPKKPPAPDPEVGKLRERVKVLQGLATTFTRVPPKSFTIPQAPPTRARPSSADAFEVLRGNLVEKIRSTPPERIEVGPISRVAAELNTVKTAVPEIGEALPAATRLLLSPASAEALPEQHRAALKSLGVDVTKTALPSALATITSELTLLHGQLAEMEYKKADFTVFGSHLYDVTEISGSLDPTWLGLAQSVPDTHGTIKPVGIGDLLIVRQNLKRYEGGEVGHIENILKGEFKKREHLRRRETETTVTVEVETKREEERDSQTTERFELQREASQVVKEDSSFKAGLSVSGSYGPTVEFKASTDFAMNHSKEESAKTATNYSKEVTSRASSKVSERHREERILRTLEVFQESNEHGVDNSHGDGHVVGVYQWVDKVYQAQVFNYGKRMMFDVMVPEPAAFWIYANAHKPKPGATLSKPQAFTLTPTQVTESNYAFYVQRYQAAGVKPPPEPYKTVSKSFEGVASHDDHNGTKVAEVPIPDGYEAVTGHAVASGSVWSDWKNDWSFTVAIGKDVWTRGPGDYVNHYFSLDNEQGSVPLGIRSYGHHMWMATIEVDCQRTERAYEAWQLETHAAIQQAYLKLERDYREELAALEVQAAGEIQGRNPVENRMLERAELKKQAISVFTAQHFDLFGAITFSPQGYPQPYLTEADAEGRYIRFFEQAFEWEHLMYLFYSYFWGRKANWVNRALLQDVDPQFAEFLKAGSARLVVPVRPGFEAALAHFMDTGEIWEGADPPTLTSPLYVSIIDEIKERTQAPGTEIEQGDPWDVRLPTTLVKLRPDNSLPSWTKQPDGSWIED